MDRESPRDKLIRIIHHHVTEEAAKTEALAALMALRDPPSPEAGAAFLAPGPKAVRRRG